MIIYKNKGLCNKGDAYQNESGIHIMDFSYSDIDVYTKKVNNHTNKGHKYIADLTRLKDLMTLALRWESLYLTSPK